VTSAELADRIGVLIVDDQALVRVGFRMILEVPFRHGYSALAQAIGQA